MCSGHNLEILYNAKKKKRGFFSEKLKSQKRDVCVKVTMIGPLLHYLYHGFYYNDNHDRVYQVPCGRTCWFFVKDCSRIIEAFGDDIKDHVKGEILYHKVMTASLMDTMDLEDLTRLRQNKEMEINVSQLLTHLYEWRYKLNATEGCWFMDYIRHLYNVALQEEKIEEDDMINIILSGTHGQLVVKYRNTLCIN